MYERLVGPYWISGTEHLHGSASHAKGDPRMLIVCSTKLDGRKSLRLALTYVAMNLVVIASLPRRYFSQ